MQTRTVGSLTVSVVGLGCNNFGWRIDESATRRVVDAAIDVGVTFLDTADIYGDTESEQFLGRVLVGRRDRVVLSSKFGKPVDAARRGARPDYVRRAVDDSLRRLRTDHLDLYQLHEPDADVPIGETLGALDELVRAGKVREIGCSNFSVAQLEEADAAARDAGTARFVSVQNEHSLLHREPEEGMLDACRALDVAFVPYYPLASGLLTGKYHRGAPPPEGSRLAELARYSPLLADEQMARMEALRKFADTRGHTLLELAFSWLLARPTVASVIAGATSAAQVRANAAAAAWSLTADELAEVDGLATAESW